MKRARVRRDPRAVAVVTAAAADVVAGAAAAVAGAAADTGIGANRGCELYFQAKPSLFRRWFCFSPIEAAPRLDELARVQNAVGIQGVLHQSMKVAQLL